MFESSGKHKDVDNMEISAAQKAVTITLRISALQVFYVQNLKTILGVGFIGVQLVAKTWELKEKPVV